MVRTNPHHDWDEPAKGKGAVLPRAGGAEWENLRNEIVALLDHVEDQVAGARQAQRAEPAPRAFDTGRRHEALRSVRQAVDRLADRSEPEFPRRDAASRITRDNVTEAINQIRARQTAASRPSAPAPVPSNEVTGVAQAIAALGERIERFEARIAAHLEEAPDSPDISAQVAQLSEVIEMLASAVGDNSQVKRINQLADTVDRLASYQVENTGRSQQFQDRQDAGLQAIEETVRNIYERIDALEVARGSDSPEIERLGREVGAISSALAASQGDAAEILARIDALQASIAQATAPGAIELGFSIEALRDAIVSAIEPRLDALAQSRDGGDIEAQLRSIAQTVEKTNAQLQALASLQAAGADNDGEPDLEALADLIVERTREAAGVATATGTPSIEKADLDALESRLASLFAADTASEASDAGLSVVRDSIAQVDGRLERLEAMLNSRPAQPAAVEAPAQPRRREPLDAMPSDPASGAPRKVLSEDPSITLEAAKPQPAHGFKIDPETVDRPAKPQSSFAAEAESPFGAQRVEPSELGVSRASVSRSSFIEAARRSARQPEVLDDTNSKSLIARALSRFQKSEDDHAEAQHESFKAAAPSVEATPDPFVGAIQPGEDAERQPGFLARNRRALLLGAALLVVITLAVPLVLNRVAAPPAQPAPATLPPAAEEPAPEPAPQEPAGDVSELMQGARMIDTAAALSPATPDTDTVLGNGNIDPIQTAALYSPPDRYIDRTTTSAISRAPASLRMPEISVPEDIEPELLRTAAEAGDARAQFEIGAILTEGHAVSQDLAQAAAWYERSGAQGFAPAQYRLGNLYESGRGVERDIQLARLWYQRAADAGNRMSMHNLASIYAGGELETQDFAAAAHWFEQAAARGLTDSQFNLGMLYARGLGVEQSFEESYFWFSLAMQSGDEDAKAAREDVARSLEAEAIQRLNERVAGWRPEAIDMAANFAPIGTWDAAFNPGQVIANRDVILRVQMLLGKLGFDVGTPDGIAGPRTRDAILAFERATGMSEKGEINPRLLAVLGSQPV
ncbi:SEL1-like repeat protein [Pelagibacterium limicola]|uniref:SEL1-like repeat protein n=1 Tax=Pelagibacterium limicola TaxID=2791022 RepID=UPI0018AF8E62|nr:SEL1-like repeat protein [Pelagibacterium limicola]